MKSSTWLCLAAIIGCGGVSTTPGAPAAAVSDGKGVAMVTPSRLVPEIDERNISPWMVEPGRTRHLLSGLRIVVHEDGLVERADERFPNGLVEAVPLPERLGGGFLFYQSDSQGTRLWRADSWTGKLRPLSYIGPSTTEVVPGFDRLYLRTRTNKLLAMSADSGAIVPLGRLPVASGFGAMAFADGWRGVVDTELRGAMITFDAGASWRPLPIEERVAAVAVVDGDPVVYVDAGHYRIDHRGRLQMIKHGELSDDDAAAGDDDGGEEGATHPLGARPLRTAIERGYPDTNDTALVVHRGKLVRVALPDARALSVNPDALDDDTAVCQGARVGSGIGFVCGAEAGPTTIAAYRPPLSLEVVARFDEPRFVSPSGNGALVVRGRCGAQVGGPDDMRSYCIVGADGSKKEIAVRGEIGAERVVALSDGRAVVLVPPRLGRPGRITVVDGDKLSSHDLVYPAEPARAVKAARRGLWLEGFEQRGKDSIGGWVEAGGPAVGVEVKLDGKVSVGTLYDEGGQLLVSGKFALVVGDGETGFESIDGGKRWNELELPRLPESSGDAKTRGCSPVGCALRGWLRVGWGKPRVDKDLQNVAQPEAVSVRPEVRSSLRLRCAVVSPPEASEAPAPDDGMRFSSWTAFMGTPPPKLGKDEIGVDASSQLADPVPVHAYVWGPKGADWTRAGWWQLRFDDRFAVGSGVRHSTLTRPPWADEQTAADRIGGRHRGYMRWDADLDPSGDGAVATLCTSGASCEAFAVSDGRPIASFREVDGSRYRRPVEHGVARIGDTWYLLTEIAGESAMTLWRAELGAMTESVRLRRLDQRRFPGAAAPKLVRRAHGSELGLLIDEPPDPATGNHVGRWYVIPLDPRTGALGEPAALGSADLDGTVPRMCSAHDDGWMLDTALTVSPAIELEGASGYLDDIELRLRLDPDGACVVALAAQAARPLAVDAFDKKAVGIPMSVRERSAGRRWPLRCRPQE